MTLNSKFNFFVPAKFEKSGEDGEMKISGICSSSVEDTDGETLEPSGFDFQPLLEKGYYNWNHQASKDPGAILGRPVSATIINGGKDFYTEGFLYKGLPQAKDLYQLAKTLEKEDPSRKLGFSIEGQAIQRDPINPKRITKARITGIAITHCPKNPNTLLNIIKGEYQDSFIEEQVEEINTEKGGEGSKGGNIIGHTKSGKPIYAIKNARHEAKYTSQDHNDAAYAHLDHASKLHKEGKEDQADRHNSMFDEHMGTYRHKRRQEEIDKSISTENVPMPESIDGVKKQILTKSQIYISIFDTYTKDIEKSEQIYNFITNVSQKLFNMADITKETLEKAFQLLDSSIEKGEKTNLSGEEKKPEDYDKKDEILKSSEETTTTTTIKDESEKDDDGDEDNDEVEKACMVEAKQRLEKGGKRGEIIDDLVEKGYSLEMSQGCVDRCISEMNAKKDGGDITTHSSLQKSEEINISKSLDEININLDQKFSALGQILKSQIESNDLIKSENKQLKEDINSLQKSLDALSKSPFPTKSVRDVRVLERFEKSEDRKQNISLSDSSQRKHLVDSLFNQVSIYKSQNRDYSTLEKAIMDIEISKSVDNNSLQLIGSLGFTVSQ